MSSINEIISILKEREKENLSLLYLIEDNAYSDVKNFGNSVILTRNNFRNSVYLYSPDEQAFRKDILSNLSGNIKHFSGIRKWMVDIIIEKYKIKRINSGFKLILPKDVVIPEVKIKPRPLTLDDAEKVNQYWEYHGEHSLDYIKHLIKNKICEGIDLNGELVAWAVTHGDGSLGMMYVLDEYRRHGYAKDITSSMVKKTRELGRYPFVHIIENNNKSLGLAQGLGFEKVCSAVWVGIE